MEREPRLVHVYRYTIDRIALPEIDFTVLCSKGFYVRTYVHDIGETLGCGAHLNVAAPDKIRSLRCGKRDDCRENEKCGAGGDFEPDVDSAGSLEDARSVTMRTRTCQRDPLYRYIVTSASRCNSCHAATIQVPNDSTRRSHSSFS